MKGSERCCPAPPALDPRTFSRLRRMIHKEAGIVLGAHKAGMVRARLAKRMAAIGCADVARYLDHLSGPDGQGERVQLVCAMTTNVTQFFREPHHFVLLRDEVIPARAAGQTLRLWSAGCASGEEPWSIAMTLAAAGLGAAEASVLGTDIDQRSVGRAAAGCYSSRELAPIPAALRRRFIAPTPGGGKIGPALRGQVSFRPLNLIRSWPFRTLFDVIFCRNVAIYFDAATQATMWWRMLEILRPGGWLFLGHSERLPDTLLGQVRYLGRTAYVKHPAGRASA